MHVDGEKVANPYEGHSGIVNASNVRSSQLGEPGKYYFLSITEEKGIWLKAETSEAFNPEKLQIEIFDYVLADKETVRLAEPSYAGIGEFGFTNVNVREEFVIYPDGSRREIELLEDEDQ